jgi:hypothetical protein
LAGTSHEISHGQPNRKQALQWDEDELLMTASGKVGDNDASASIVEGRLSK